jgi:N-acetylmuramoyl-L-alanine amidase CwlA
MRLYPASNSVVLLNRNVAGNSNNYRALYLHNSSASSSINSALVLQDTISGTPNNYNVLHAGNYNSYAPTKTGGGASGTWGISISGNAVTATRAS